MYCSNQKCILKQLSKLADRNENMSEKLLTLIRIMENGAYSWKQAKNVNVG